MKTRFPCCGAENSQLPANNKGYKIAWVFFILFAGLWTGLTAFPFLNGSIASFHELPAYYGQHTQEDADAFWLALVLLFCFAYLSMLAAYYFKRKP